MSIIEEVFDGIIETLYNTISIAMAVALLIMGFGVNYIALTHSNTLLFIIGNVLMVFGFMACVAYLLATAPAPIKGDIL